MSPRSTEAIVCMPADRFTGLVMLALLVGALLCLFFLFLVGRKP